MALERSRIAVSDTTLHVVGLPDARLGRAAPREELWVFQCVLTSLIYGGSTSSAIHRLLERAYAWTRLTSMPPTYVPPRVRN